MEGRKEGTVGRSRRITPQMEGRKELSAEVVALLLKWKEGRNCRQKYSTFIK
jgi:hypothetical protein